MNAKKRPIIAGVAMPDELKKYAVLRAKQDGRSLSAWIRRLIELHRNGQSLPRSRHEECQRQPA